MNVPIIIRQRGRLANQMFQYMLALELSKKLNGAPIFGHHIPEWGLIGPSARGIPAESFLIAKHRVNMQNLLDLIQKRTVGGVVIEGWGMRLEYFDSPLDYRRIFCSDQRAAELQDNDLLIHIRAEDILSGWHPSYFPMAFSYFEKIIMSTGLNPVFMGQIGQDAYSLALRRRFSGAKFLPRNSPVADFQTIRNARHVVLSMSSFSWLAAWISESAEDIHLPVAGLFDPRRSDANLLPVADSRYHFYKVPFLNYAERSKIDLVSWANSADGVRRLL